MTLSFDALGLLLHHTEGNPDFEEAELERIIVSAEAKCGEEIDREEACMKLALLHAAVADGEKWHKIAYLLTTPDAELAPVPWKVISRKAAS